MAKDGEKKSGHAEAPDEAASESDAKSGGNSLQDASEEMVRFMEQDDEPGHVGRGDGG
jgi:hypothetical protein